MFVLRSAFWLAVGFIVVAPHGTDLGATAGAMKDQAVAAGLNAGERLIVSQVFAADASPRSVLAGIAHSPSADSTMQDSSEDVAPFPRQRPRSMG